jgi:RNA polymerase sigma-70 factor, ECF subfamily
MDTKSIDDIIQRLKAGDFTAFDEFYAATKEKVYRTVYILVVNKQEVEEIVNEVYFQIWKSISNYNESSPFSYWLNGLVFRQVKQWRLKAWKRKNLLEKLLNNIYFLNEGDAGTDMLIGERRRTLLSTLDTMSYKFKEVVVLYYFHDYSQREIAMILNIPMGTVKSRHHSALKHLRKYYMDINDLDKEEFFSVK